MGRPDLKRAHTCLGFSPVQPQPEYEPSAIEKHINNMSSSCTPLVLYPLFHADICLSSRDGSRGLPHRDGQAPRHVRRHLQHDRGPASRDRAVLRPQSHRCPQTGALRVHPRRVRRTAAQDQDRRRRSTSGEEAKRVGAARCRGHVQGGDEKRDADEGGHGHTELYARTAVYTEQAREAPDNGYRTGGWHVCGGGWDSERGDVCVAGDARAVLGPAAAQEVQ